MAARAELGLFVREALMAGRGRAEIRATLLDAGWRERDVTRALSAFADVPSIPPVPRPRPFVSGRDGVIYGLAFFALSVALVNLVGLLFDLVEAWLAPADRWNLERQSWNIAAILVFAPLFGAIDYRADRDSPTRKVFAYAALFFAVVVLLFTLVGVLALALGGGLDAEVGLKAMVLAGTAGGVLAYYRKDLVSDREVR